MRSPVALALPFLILVAAGCGGGSSPSVASLGGTGSTTDSAATGASSGSSPGSSAGTGNGVGFLIGGGSNGLRFSRCMRSHGVSSFPDPNSQGGVEIGPSSGIDPGSSSFQTALRACQSLVGGGKGPSHLGLAQQAKARQQALAFSACMREHGVPGYPDPTFLDGGAVVKITPQAGTNLDSASPTFQAAQQACRGRLPKGAKAGGFSTGGPK
ncbi:MAG TPA: hypothetical protein VMG74_02425 [Gaiellaceae bacterium]|nr:hypothetical protein [Gaiellaceae bacterium]